MSWFTGFDFDGCLLRKSDGTLIEESARKLREVEAAGGMPLIMTSRTASHELPSWYEQHEPDRVCVWPFIVAHDLPVHGVIFCAHVRKLTFLTRFGITEHYDNSRTVVGDCNTASGSHTRGHLLGDIVG